MPSLKILGFTIGILLMASIFAFFAGIVTHKPWLMAVAGGGLFVSGILIVIALRKLNIAIGVIQDEVERRIRKQMKKVEREGPKTDGSDPKQG